MHVPSTSGCTPLGKSWAHSFPAQSHWWNLSWKTRANSSALLALLSANEATHVPSTSGCTPLGKSWAHSFSAQSHWWNLSWKTRANSSALLALLSANEAMHVPSPSVLHTAWQVLGAQFFGTIALMEFVLKTCANSSRFPLHIAPSHRSSPKLFLTVSRPSTLSSLPSRSLPTQLTPPDPAQRHKRHACHANGTWMSISATPATRNASGCRQVPRLPRKVPRRPGRPTGTKPATRCSPVP